MTDYQDMHDAVDAKYLKDRSNLLDAISAVEDRDRTITHDDVLYQCYPLPQGKLKPTGSRFFNSPDVKTNSDYDFYCLGKSYEVMDLMFDGWSYGDGQFYEGGQFASLRQGSVNLLIFFDDEQYRRFDLATSFVNALGRHLDRPARVEVFRHFLYPEGGSSPTALALMLVNNLE